MTYQSDSSGMKGAYKRRGIHLVEDLSSAGRGVYYIGGSLRTSLHLWSRIRTTSVEAFSAWKLQVRADSTSSIEFAHTMLYD